MQPVSFGVLRQFLLDLGFTMRFEPGQFARFDEEESKAWFLFPALHDNDPVPMPYLVSVRKLLDDRGIFPREEFDKLLGKDLVAG